MFYTHFEDSVVNLNSDIIYISKLQTYGDSYYYFRYVFNDKTYIDIELKFHNNNKNEIYNKIKDYKQNIVSFLNTRDEKYLKLNDAVFSTINLKKDE